MAVVGPRHQAQGGQEAWEVLRGPVGWGWRAPDGRSPAAAGARGSAEREAAPPVRELRVWGPREKEGQIWSNQLHIQL